MSVSLKSLVQEFSERETEHNDDAELGEQSNVISIAGNHDFNDRHKRPLEHSGDDFQQEQAHRTKVLRQEPTARSAGSTHTVANCQKLDCTVTSSFQRLDDIYRVSNPETVCATINISDVHDVLHQALEPPPPPKPPIIHWKRPGRFKNPQPDDYATPEQIQLRNAKRNREFQWMDIRSRWKRRRNDVRSNAIDVGGAISSALQHASFPGKARTRVKSVDYRHMIRGEAGLNQRRLPLDEESSHDQGKSLSDYMFGSSLNKDIGNPSSVLVDENNGSKNDKNDPIFIPFEDFLDYWDLGYSAPDWDSTTFTYNQRLSWLSNCSFNDKIYPMDRRLIASEAKIMTLPNMPTNTNYREMNIASSTSYQESDYNIADNNVWDHSNYVHGRHGLICAARLIGTSSMIENPFVLLRNVLRKVPRQSDMILQYLAQTGLIMQIFWTHRWKNRASVVELLGISRDRQAVGPSDNYHGYKAFDVKWGFRMGLERVVRQSATGILKGAVDIWSVSPFCIPSTTWSPTPGSFPPVPQLPLDETGIILGPIDKFLLYTTAHEIDDSAFRLAYAYLWQSFTASTSFISRSQAKHNLLLVSEKTLQVLRKKELVRIRTVIFRSGSDIPQPMRYRACSMLLSIYLNGLHGFSLHPPFGHESDESIEDEETHPAFYPNESCQRRPKDCADLQGLCTFLFLDLKKELEFKGLERFPRLRLVYALLRVAKDLPSTQARLLAEPIGGPDNPTPFEHLKRLICNLEENGQLLDSAELIPLGRSCVRIGDLEFAFYQASDTFQRLAELDPTDLMSRCWHLASLSVCLLLSCGNEIGSAPSLYHGSSKECNSASLIELGGTGVIPPKTVKTRKVLPKFHELRKEVAASLRLLFDLAKKQGHLLPRAHLAVSSFLEWGQVVALMLGPESCETNFSAVRTIHRHHKTEWTLHGGAEAVAQASNATWNSHNSQLHKLAYALELNPHEVSNWRNLALKLGTIGKPAKYGKCTKRFCKACGMLVSNYTVDHNLEMHYQCPENNWWGKERRSWWAHTVLDISNIERSTPPGRNVKKARESLQEIMSKVAVYSSDENLDDSDNIASLKSSLSFDSCYENIVTTALASDPASYERHSTGKKTITVQHLLPLESKQDGSSFDSDELEYLQGLNRPVSPDFVDQHDVSKSDLDSHDLEVTCYKIIIASHLYSPGHKWVRSQVLTIANKCWHSKRCSINLNSKEMQALKWLYKMHLSGPNAMKIAVREQQSS